MKKKILLLLSIIVLILFGCFIYLSIEESKYSDEKYTLNKETEIPTYSTEQQVINIETENTEEVTLIPELEDLSLEEYASYSFFNFESLELYPSKKKASISYGDEITIKLEGKEGFELYKENENIYNYYDFFNEKGNVRGFISYSNEDYTEENIAEDFSTYKNIDEQFLTEGYYDYYNFGEIKEIEYKGLKGVYNLTESSRHNNLDDSSYPIESKYTAYFNYNGKVLHIIIRTYKNCSFGQKSFIELLDSSIEFN